MRITISYDMLIIVSYDISDDDRRNALASELKNYGARVQKSVFECHLDHDEYGEMRRTVEGLIDLAEDNVRFYFLCSDDRSKRETEGQGQVTKDSDYFVV